MSGGYGALTPTTGSTICNPALHFPHEADHRHSTIDSMVSSWMAGWKGNLQGCVSSSSDSSSNNFNYGISTGIELDSSNYRISSGMFDPTNTGTFSSSFDVTTATANVQCCAET
jgi:hypothetical protein